MKSVINLAFTLLLLLASSFSFSATLYKAEGWPSIAPYLQVTPELACSETQNYMALPANTSYEGYAAPFCNYRYTSGGLYQIRIVSDIAVCPSGYVDDGGGQCVLDNPYNCEPNKAMFATVSKGEDGLFPDAICQPQTAGGDNYCVYGSTHISISPDDTMSILYKTASEQDGPAKCTEPTDIIDSVRLPFSPDSFTGQLTEQDTRVVESDNNYSAPNTVCVANGDGTDTCTTISQNTQNTVEGKGTTTTSDGTKATMTTHNGNTTSSTETTTTTDDGNGASTTTKQVTNSTTAGGSTSTTFDSSTGSETSTTTPDGQTVTTTTTTTIQTNPDGSTTTTSTTDTSTKPSDSSVDGNCGADGQPACVITFEGQDGLGKPDDILNGSGINGQYDGLIEEIGNIGNEDISDKTLDNPFSLPTTGTCNPASFSVEYHGHTNNPMIPFCEVYDNHLHAVLRYFVYGLMLIYLYRLYLSTTERT